MQPIGLYLHIPFCKGKCPYCDFYSVTPKDGIIDDYTEALCRKIERENRIFDTVYFGGGTPSLLGSERIAKIMSVINRTKNCEATLECNPSDTGGINSDFDFYAVKSSGINRISMGLQSANDEERRFLGRRSGADDAARAVKRAQSAGIENISLDLMLGIEGQTRDKLSDSINFCASLGVKHISAYILKLEQGTPLYRRRDSLSLPSEDETCDLYLFAAEKLAENGFFQYEISNFSVPGSESRHNLKYWHCEEYLGIGAAAHSFVDGKRFFYERSIDSFINGNPPIDDGTGGDREEYIMLALRLTEGLIFKKFESRFGSSIPEGFVRKAADFEKHGLTRVNKSSVSLTPEGFLLSNSIIFELLEKI